MHIDIIETMPSLVSLEADWNAAYDADPVNWLQSKPGSRHV